MAHNQREKKRREQLFRKQGGRCYWCNCQMVLIHRTGGRQRVRLAVFRARRRRSARAIAVLCWFMFFSDTSRFTFTITRSALS